MTDQLQSKIIEDNPIRDGLDAFRALFNSICEGVHLSHAPNALQQLSQEGKKDNVTLLKPTPLATM